MIFSLMFILQLGNEIIHKYYPANIASKNQYTESTPFIPYTGQKKLTLYQITAAMSFAMPLFNSVISWLLKKRIHQIELFMKYPEEVQSEWFIKLVSTAKDTECGRNYDFVSIKTIEEFKERIPVSTYEEMQPFIDRLRKGEQNILWPSDIRWFAKSSGDRKSVV